jgi:phosphohistidine phosphatase
MPDSPGFICLPDPESIVDEFPMNAAGRHLILMRHAKSSWSNGDCADHDRDLNPRGIRAARQMARLLASEQLQPDFVWCSTATRARRTLAQMLGEWDKIPPILFESVLYLAQPETVLDVIARTPPGHSQLLVIGHNPGLEELVALLAGRPAADDGTTHMPTAAVAVFEHSGPGEFDAVSAATCQFIRLWKPRQLAGES